MMMKSELLFIVMLHLLIVKANAQDIQGTAFYKSKTTVKDLNTGGHIMTEEMKTEIEKAMEKSYVLNFNKFESVYEEEQKIDAPSPAKESGFRILNSEGKKYKNIKEKNEIFGEELFGKEFLIVDSLAKWDWKLQNETKKIGDYLCYKAVAMIPVTKKEKADFEESKKKSSPTQFFLKEPQDKVITVWYAPEIPISQGPDNYWGLPGLILEANDGKTVTLCSKIILNPKEKTEIKPPKKGKKVTREEYKTIFENQLEKMKDSKGGIRIEGGH